MRKYILLFFFCISYSSVMCQVRYKAEEAGKHIGDSITVCGKIFSGSFLESSVTKPTLLNMGGLFPNHLLTIMIAFNDRVNFPVRPEELFVQKNVCVTGQVIDYKGKPEIIVTNPMQIRVEPDVVKSEIVGNDVAKVLRDTAKKEMVVKDTLKKEVLKKDTLQKEIPKKSVITAPNVEVEDSYDIKVTSEVNLREKPNKDAKVLAIVKPGTMVSIFKSQNGWSKVSISRFSTAEQKTIVISGFIKNSVLK